MASFDDTTRRSAPTLETGRLRLRHYRKSDFAAQHAIVGDEAVMRQLGAPALDAEECWRRLAASVGTWDLMGFGGWAVVRKSDDKLVGTVSLFNAWRALEPSFGEEPEMGWIFAREVHGQGHGRRGVPRGARLGRRATSRRPRCGRSSRPAMRPRSSWPSGSGSSGTTTASIKDEPITVLKRPPRRARKRRCR